MPTLLVVGASGALGSTLSTLASQAGYDVVGTHHRTPVPGLTSVPMNLTDSASVISAIERTRPDVVINAAYEMASWPVTAVGPTLLAGAARQRGARFLHVSSDAVFSGTKSHYVETDSPDPVNPYGAAKAAAETAVQALDAAASIVRTSLILGTGRGFEATVRELALGRREGVLFTDDLRCAVHVSDLAAACLELIEQRGIHHVAGSEAVSRWQLGQLICARDGLPTAGLRSGLRASLPTPGPLDLRLDCTTTQTRLKTRLRGATEFLRSTSSPGIP